MAQVFLPCESRTWPEDKKYFELLSKISSAKEFEQLVKENSDSADKSVVNTAQRISSLQGLSVFLNDIATEEERDTFFTKTLPFICRSASCLDALVPEQGVPFLRQQEGASVFLGRKLVLSLIANAFLCTFPHVHPLEKKVKPFSFGKFFKIFMSGDKSQLSSQAAKLKCFLNYFNRMSFREEDGVPGTICYTRQAISKEELPSLTDWKNCEYPLCGVSVANDKKIEDAGSRTLQVDFAASHIGGGVLRGGRVQEEIRFCICPELVVSMLITDAMEDNEAIVITGHERFSYYDGYAATLKYGGDYEDPSEKDIYGNLNTALTAINAIAYQGSNGEEQYQEVKFLRDLNKALVGFLCRDERGDISLQSVPMRQGEYTEDGEEDYSMCETTSQMTWEESLQGESIDAYTLSLSSDIISQAVRTVQNEEGSGGEEEEEEEREEKGLDDALRQMASSLVGSVMDDILKTKQNDVLYSFDDFAAEAAASILTSVKQDLLSSSSSSSSVTILLPLPVQTQGLPSSDQEGTPRSRSSSYTGQPLLPIEYTDTVVEEAINKGIDEAFQSEVQISLPPPPTLQVNIEDTEKDQTSPVVEPKGFADKLATDILGSAFPIPPAKKTFVTLSSAGGKRETKKPSSLKLASKPQKSKSYSRRSFPRSGQNSTDNIDILDPRTLNPPSSRMSIAWSTTSTRGEDSMPTSPTELDHIAIRMVNSIKDLATVLAELIIRDAIQACALPQEISDHLSVNQYDKEQVSSSKGMSKIDTFLQSLHEAESHVSLDVSPMVGLLPFSLPLYNIRKDILRPVATGNWGCGAFKGDPQLKSMLQWMAVSASSRPEMKYYPFSEKRVQQLPEVVDKLLPPGTTTTVGQLCQLVAQYCAQRTDKSHQEEDLFTYLLKH